jgi:pseudouridylate synthase / pseudouridine kinase
MELHAIANAIEMPSSIQSSDPFINDAMRQELSALRKMLTLFDNVVVKMGDKGVLVGSAVTQQPGHKSTATYHNYTKDNKCWEISYLPAGKVQNIVNVTGAGDSLVGVLVAGLARHPNIDHEALCKLVRKGMDAAELTLSSPFAVSDKIKTL